MFMSTGRGLSLYSPLMMCSLITSWKVRDICPMPLSEYTMRASGTAKAAPGASLHEKSMSFMPMTKRVRLCCVTSAVAVKLPEYTSMKP